MAVIDAELYAAVGKYQDKDGKERTKTRKVGAIMTHSDGRRYVQLDPFFNFGAVERKPGSDRIFLSISKVDGKNG